MVLDLSQFSAPLHPPSLILLSRRYLPFTVLFQAEKAAPPHCCI